MDDIKETILSDAIETAIVETKNNIILKRIAIAEGIIIFLLLLILLGG